MRTDTSQVLTLTFLFALIVKIVLEKDCGMGAEELGDSAPSHSLQ